MNTNRHITGLPTILLLASLVSTHPVTAEDCYLDTNDDGVGDSTAAESNGDDKRLACGRLATATGNFSTAVGYETNATGIGAVAVGYSADATATYTTAIGIGAEAIGFGATAIGRVAGAWAQSSTALGSGSTAASVGSTALGQNASISGTAPGAIAIGGDLDGSGYGARATAENAIVIGADAVASVANTVILGSPSATTKVGINTGTPSSELDIRSGSPAIRLDDTSAGQGRVDLDMSGNEFAIEGNTNLDIVEVDSRSPEHALSIRNNGDVGIGLRGALADLHVRGEGVSGPEEVARFESAVPPAITMADTTTTREVSFEMNSGGALKLLFDGKQKFVFSRNGTLTVKSLNQTSDRASKTAITTVDNRKILDAVVDLPISSWEYKGDEGVRHLGPMGQDFHAVFGLGDSPRGISSIDTGGVALAAIKGLNQVVQEKDQEIQSLKAASKRLTDTNEELSTRLTMLENLVNKLAANEVVMSQ